MSNSLELFIRVDENGNAVDHPILGDNFQAAFPTIDTDNLPSNFARFVRVPQPTLGIYQVLESETPTYQLVDGVFTDCWSVRDMTDDEKLNLQQAVRNRWSSLPYASNFTAWVLDETICQMVPPTPKPSQDHAWDGTTDSWKIRDPVPADGKDYRWNPLTWSWMELLVSSD